MRGFFQGVRRRVAHVHIRSKILVIYLVIGVLPFALFSVNSYRQANRQLVLSETAMLQNALDQALQTLNGTLDMYSTVSNYLFNEQNILTALNRTYGTKYYEMYETYKDTIAPVLMTHYSLYEHLSRITLYTGSDLLPYNTYADRLEILERAPWFPAVQGSFAPVWIVHQGQTGPRLSLVRRIGIPSQYRQINYLYMEVDYDSVFQPLTGISASPYAVIVTDRQDEPVFAYSTLGDLELSDVQHILHSAQRRNYRVMETKLRGNGWTAYCLSDPNAILGAVNSITNTTYYTAWGVLLVLAATAVLFILHIIWPIEQLTRNIQQIDDNHMAITVRTNRTDEVGILVRSVTDMIARINGFIDTTYRHEIEKREYQARLLSAQINPHFLYNSLSLINSKAILAGQQQISDMTILLSKFYRSALNHGQDVTTLDNEWNNIKAYIWLQQMLCDGFFDVRYDIDDGLLDVRIPNFILQPFVENAIDHGLKQSPYRDRLLEIGIAGQGESVVISIADNGKGIDEATLVSLFTQQTKGYGIKNVHDRLRLFYGQRFDLRIESQPGKPTLVTLRLPKEL